MNKNEDFRLVGHLQVLDEPLASLYTDRISGKLFIFVRIYEENDKDDSTFILTEVKSPGIMDYMEGKRSLSSLFSNRGGYYYRANHHVLSSDDFVPIDNVEIQMKLNEDGLDDMYDSYLGYQTMKMKKYLRQHI